MKNNYARLGQGFAHPKNSLPCYSTGGYALKSPAKSGVGIGVLHLHTATQTRRASFLLSQHNHTQIMVGCVGASHEAPVSVCAGYANPAQFTTSEIGVSGGEVISSHTEAATWLLPQPKNCPNLPGFSSVRQKARRVLPLLSASLPTVSKKPASGIPAGILFLPPKFALNVRFISTVAARLNWMLRKWEVAMFNLQTLTAKARELRGNVLKASTTKGTRTMTPVYEREEQRKLRERIQQTQPDWVLLWWDIATVTGWRTSDVCNFRYSCINWETGIATIIVAKQTKAAEARATRKGIEIVRQQRKDAARLAGDHIAYMHWDSVSCDELAAGMTEEEQAIVFELVAKAEVKHDTKQLPPGIVKRLRERMERNLIGDNLVFSPQPD
ncbi:ash family protein [Escherichia coli]